MSETQERLFRRLVDLDGHSYPSYRSITGTYRFPSFTLTIDHVQADPFAAPSRMHVQLTPQAIDLPSWSYQTKERGVTTADWLLRRFAMALHEHAKKRRGSGKSDLIAVDEPGQEILPRTACQVSPEQIELRLLVGLPAAGRRILGREAAELLCTLLAQLVEQTFSFDERALSALQRQVETVGDAQALRTQLHEAGLLAFIADRSLLARESGVSDKPYSKADAIYTQAPDSLAVTLTTPHAGSLRGLGIPVGITLIVGGGYHGKSTLLRAIAKGIYDHVPGDGREYVVTDPRAVVIRAEDGRSLCNVDISGFIETLPSGKSTTAFSTENASGSTSQAGNIVEALELGASALLVDEDTSATNFMIRDRRMQALVSKAHEPITPFIDRVRELHQRFSVSSVLVIGGAGDYLDVADTVIRMDTYQPYDTTQEARLIAHTFPTGRQMEASDPFPRPKERIPLPASLEPFRGKKIHIRAHGTDSLQYGGETIDLTAVTQLISPSQTRTIGLLLQQLIERDCNGRQSLRQALEKLYEALDEKGLDLLAPGQHHGELALPRLLEAGAALNRLRTLKIQDDRYN
ncbi:MAG: ABC-ATPase domain-containing protein, partial [Firmicutes bacterium]|nr:ABC-ATPase domain-containing protein [Bacillota bacterium]